MCLARAVPQKCRYADARFWFSRYKSWKLIGLHPLCAVLFTAGYALREYGAYNYIYVNNTVLIIFVLSQVFVYVCP